MTVIRVALAGVPAEVVCRCPENEAFLAAYRTEQAPVFRVAPGEADLAAARAGFERSDRTAGRPVRPCREDLLENAAIHRLLAEELAQRGVLLMHGSALCMDGEAYVFTAPSGTGKSTHARMWREAFGDRVWMINDDKPMLRVGAGGVTVHGTPWMGKHGLGRNASAPLRAIVSLSRDSTDHIAPMPKQDAFALLLRRSLTSENRAVMQAIVALEAEIVAAADFYRLGCTPTVEAARTARAGMLHPLT